MPEQRPARITQPGRRGQRARGMSADLRRRIRRTVGVCELVLAERKLPDRTSEKGQPPVDFDAGLLSSWVQAELGLKEPGGQEVQTPEDLAGRIAAELQSQALYFVLDEAQRLLGGVAAFTSASGFLCTSGCRLRSRPARTGTGLDAK
jgi:hypothetical protein